MTYTEDMLGNDPDGLLDQVDARTNLAGTNKMEILLFSLGSGEKFGINVFKIKEVCHAGKITRTPNMPAGVDGIVSLRGHVMPVLNLANFMGISPTENHHTMMVAEYSNHILGFLVKEVDRIIRVDWDKVRATEGMLSDKGALITAITELPDGSLISILDVEQILANAFGDAIVGNVERVESEHDLCIFFADDSMVARRKIAEVLDKMGVKQIQANLTDAEMPEMDGYVLTQNIKADRRFDGIPVVMHSSLSSDANRAMGRRAGVDHYVPKFDSIVLSSTLRP